MSLSVAFVILCQFLMGFGLMTRLRAVSNGLSLLGLSMLAGLGISSVLPFVLEFCHLPIARIPLFIGLGVLALSATILVWGQVSYLRTIFSWQRLNPRLCEIPFLLFWGYLLFISGWKCAWFPNIAFDTIVGPDLVAVFAVREHTLASSVFTEHLPSVSLFSNQPFYAPFTAMQQIIYRLASEGIGLFAFGKLWLSLLVIGFGAFFYGDLRERIHPVLAGLLISLLACSPELFAYTFLVQTDWANAAFFSAGVLLLQRYGESARRGELVAGTLLLALACWTRTETIIFVPIGCVLLVAHSARSEPARGVVRALILFVVCCLPVVFWNYGFLRGYVPLPPNAHPGAVHTVTGNYAGQLLAVYTGMNRQVVFATNFWNYGVIAFLVLAVLNSLIFRDRRGLDSLIWLTGMYLLFGLLILHVDGANIPYTFRRGFFKLLLLMYVYLGRTSLMRWLSNRLYKWEGSSLSRMPSHSLLR